MSGFFDPKDTPAAPARLERLRLAANIWIGTPFVAHSQQAGAGVDCVNLAAAIYISTGALMVFRAPPYSLDGGQHQTASQVVEWLLNCPSFRPILDKEDAIPGDLLCFKFGRSEHHVGVMTSVNQFIHARNRRRVEFASLTDPVYRRCLSAVYRPIESP